MAGIRQAANTLTRATSRQPKTILGFVAIALGIVCAFSGTAVVALSRVSTLHWLILPIIVAVVVIVVAVLVVVFVIAWKDPTKVMLGEVTAEEFIQYQRLSLGDSESGERATTIIETSPEKVGDASATEDESQ